MAVGESLSGTLGFMSGSRVLLRLGALTAMALLGTKMRGQSTAPHPATGPVHSISPDIVRAVIGKLPKYAPPAPSKTTEPASDESSTGSGDIFRLPKVTVRERAPDRPDPFDLLTPKGKLELALKSHPGLRVGNIFGMNNGIALAIQAEERDVEKKAALTDTVRHTTSDSSPEGKRMMRLLKAALQRPNTDWMGK
jgi:hypothetical protein